MPLPCALLTHHQDATMNSTAAAIREAIMSTFCTEPKCMSIGVIGGYCESHQAERANAIQLQLDQRNESAARMSREITERISRETQLEGELATARRALAQQQTTRAELLDTIAALKAENEQLQGECESWADRVKKLEEGDAKFSRDLSEALNSGDGVYRP